MGTVSNDFVKYVTDLRIGSAQLAHSKAWVGVTQANLGHEWLAARPEHSR